MEHSKNFEMVKNYYDIKLWDLNRVWRVTNKVTGITEAEYYEITGIYYPSKELPQK